MSQYGVDNTKEVLALAFEVASTVKKARKNGGKFDLSDLPLVMAIIPKIEPAFKDIGDVPKEIKDLDNAEAAELQNFIMSRFGELVGREELVKQVDLGLKAIIAVYEFVNALRD